MMCKLVYELVENKILTDKISFRKRVWKDENGEDDDKPEFRLNEMKIAKIIMNANNNSENSLLRVYDVTKDHIDYQLLDESWRGNAPNGNYTLEESLKTHLMSTDAPAQIRKQLLQLHSLGIAYFDLHYWNIGQDMDSGEYKLFDFDHAYIKGTKYPYYWQDYGNSYSAACLNAVYDKDGKCAEFDLVSNVFDKSKKQCRRLLAFRQAWFRAQRQPSMTLRSGLRANGLPLFRPKLQRAIAYNDIDALRFYYILGEEF